MFWTQYTILLKYSYICKNTHILSDLLFVCQKIMVAKLKMMVFEKIKAFQIINKKNVRNHTLDGRLLSYNTNLNDKYVISS